MARGRRASSTHSTGLCDARGYSCAPIAELAEQAVLITGAGRGLGRAIAVRLAQHGAAVGLIDIDAATVRTAQQIRAAAGGRRPTRPTCRPAALLEAAGRFAADHAGLDAVINNAMLLRYEPLTAITEAVADQMLGIGIKGAIWGSQHCWPT